MNEDTTVTPDEGQQEQDSESSDNEILLSQLLGKGVKLLIAIVS